VGRYRREYRSGCAAFCQAGGVCGSAAIAAAALLARRSVSVLPASRGISISKYERPILAANYLMLANSLAILNTPNTSYF
jgi:hypothetical protein